MRFGRLYLLTFLSLFGLLTPLAYRTFAFHDRCATALLAAPLTYLSNLFFGVQSSAVLSSDSITLYLWVVILLVFALSILLPRFTLITHNQLITFMEKLLIYFLVLQLMRYGFDKVFKSQFYLPEPNILATELGQLDQDILFWSTMGSSHGYNLYMGFGEVLAASLLLFRKTRVLGLLLASGIFLQIFAINLSFDISVKLFSALLLLMTLTCLAPFAKALFGFFLGGKTGSLPAPKQIYLGRFHRPLKMTLLFLIGIESMFAYVLSGNFNDDLAERPYLHGMYVNSDPSSNIKRLFVHRDGYIILEDSTGNKADYALQINQAKQELNITNYQLKTRHIPYAFDSKQKQLIVEFNDLKKEHFTYSEWRTLPLLLNKRHWTVDAGF